jgi:hypothetical protein
MEVETGKDRNERGPVKEAVERATTVRSQSLIQNMHDLGSREPYL